MSEQLSSCWGNNDSKQRHCFLNLQESGGLLGTSSGARYREEQGSGAEDGLVAREPDGPAGAISVGLTIKQMPGKQTPSPKNPHPTWQRNESLGVRGEPNKSHLPRGGCTGPERSSHPVRPAQRPAVCTRVCTRVFTHAQPHQLRAQLVENEGGGMVRHNSNSSLNLLILSEAPGGPQLSQQEPGRVEGVGVQELRH